MITNERSPAAKHGAASALITGGDSGMGRAIAIPGDLREEAFCTKLVDEAGRGLSTVNNQQFSQHRHRIIQ